MADTYDLAPCPFCGTVHSVRVKDGAYKDQWYIGCGECGATGPMTAKASTAARLWNERLNPRLLEPHVETPTKVGADPEAENNPDPARNQPTREGASRRGRGFTEEQRKAASERMKRMHREGLLRKPA